MFCYCASKSANFGIRKLDEDLRFLQVTIARLIVDDDADAPVFVQGQSADNLGRLVDGLEQAFDRGADCGVRSNPFGLPGGLRACAERFDVEAPRRGVLTSENVQSGVDWPSSASCLNDFEQNRWQL